MSTLLLGRWDHGGNLLIEESHRIENDADTGPLVDGQDDTDNMAWSATFDTGDHRAAVDAAYEEYVHEERDGKNVGGTLIDRITGLRLRKG